MCRFSILPHLLSSRSLCLPVRDRKPEGGAKMGATFCGRILPQQGQPPEGPSPNPFPKGPTATSIATTTQDPLDSEIPMGAWRDGICDCCVKFPVCCMAYCCEMSKYHDCCAMRVGFSCFILFMVPSPASCKRYDFADLYTPNQIALVRPHHFH